MCIVRQLKEKTDQSHISQQQALSLKKLEEARQDKIKKLVWTVSVSEWHNTLCYVTKYQLCPNLAILLFVNFAVFVQL